MGENCLERMEPTERKAKIASFVQKQKESYEFKVKYAEIRAREFVRECENRGLNYHVSVGGLDSITLFLFLKHIGIDAPGISISYLEDISIQRVHHELGIETLLSALKPDGTRWNKSQILQEFGFPVLSKEIAKNIEVLSNPTERNETLRHSILTGETGEYGGFQKNSRMKMSQKWLEKFGGYVNEIEGTNYLTPDFKVSSKCCYYLKEKPLDIWAKEHNSVPFFGLMASEGGRRAKSLMVHGCNYFGKSAIRSAPFAIFSRQDLLQLAINLKVPIPDIYGEIKQKEDGTLYTTGAQRTGCSMCGFGIHLEKRPHRFDHLRERNPKEWHYWMYECCENADGSKYGWGKVLDYIGVGWEDDYTNVNKGVQTMKNAEKIPAENTSVILADKKAIDSHLKSLDNAVKSERKAFIKVACELHWFKETQAYAAVSEKGYANIEEFSKDRYGIKKAMTYQYLGIAETFGKKDNEGNVIDLDDAYKDYGITQLIIMKGMSNDLLNQCNSEMKVSELKKIAALSDNKNDSGKSSNDDNKNNSDRQEKQNNDSEQTNKNEQTDKNLPVIKQPNSQELYNISTVEDLEKKQTEILKALKRILEGDVLAGKGNGVKYGISILMTW